MAHGKQEPGRLDEGWIGSCPLPDGRTVWLRHVRPDDAEAIADAIRTASPETLLHRFFTPIRSLPPGLLRSLLTIDRRREACIVGILDDAPRRRIVCGARFVRLEAEDRAEIAITVHDDFQRRGLGRCMLKLLVEIARQEGIVAFEAEALATNRALPALVHSVCPGAARRQHLGESLRIVVELDACGGCERSVD